MIPTRWVAQMEGQLADAERRLAAARRHCDGGAGSRALEEAYPGVMAAALVTVWLRDEPWRRPRSADELQRMVRDALPGGFATLLEVRQGPRGFAGWRAEDARPLLDEAQALILAARAALTASTAASTPTT